MTATKLVSFRAGCLILPDYACFLNAGISFKDEALGISVGVITLEPGSQKKSELCGETEVSQTLSPARSCQVSHVRPLLLLDQLFFVANGEDGKVVFTLKDDKDNETRIVASAVRPSSLPRCAFAALVRLTAVRAVVLAVVCAGRHCGDDSWLRLRNRQHIEATRALIRQRERDACGTDCLLVRCAALRRLPSCCSCSRQAMRASRVRRNRRCGPSAGDRPPSGCEPPASNPLFLLMLGLTSCWLCFIAQKE